MQVAHPVVVLNLPEETRFVDVFLRQHGIRSAVAVPLKLQDRAFGALVACSSEDCRFDDDDVLFVETIGHLVATTIARRQTEDSLTEQRRLAEGVLHTVDTPVLVLDTQWRILRSNAACERTSGFSLDDVEGRPIWNAFSFPEEAGVFGRLFEKLKQGASPVEFESYLLTKHSQRRRIAWSCSAMVGGDGTLESIIATGIDVTEQREAEQKAAQAEREAEEARQAMASLMAASPDEAAESPSAPDSKAWPTDGAPAVDTFGRLPIPLNAERRKRPRRSYPYKQRIAPVVRGQLPRLDALEEVQCNDIAAGGFSFLYPKPPESDMLVVALGVPPKITYLIAQVCHITRKEKDGKRVFLVGCNYVGRASY